MKRLILSVCVTLATVTAWSALAGASNGNSFQFPLTCGSTTYQVTVAGNGDWTPARDDNSTLVFHPTALGEFTGTFTPTGGDPQTETDPPQQFKAQRSNGRPRMDCTYHIHFEDDSGVFDGNGSATVYTTGAPKS